MRIKINQPAEPGTKFGPTAFDSQIGKTVPFRVGGDSPTECTIVAATIVGNGDSAELTLDVPDDLRSVLGDLGPFSLG